MAHWFGSWISFVSSSLALAGNAQGQRHATVVNSRIVRMTTSSAGRANLFWAGDLRNFGRKRPFLQERTADQHDRTQRKNALPRSQHPDGSTRIRREESRAYALEMRAAIPIAELE